MQMASFNSLLSLFILLLIFSISSAYNRKWASPNGLNQNPIRMIDAVSGVSEDPVKLNGVEAQNNGRNGKSQSIIVGPWGDRVTNSNGVTFDDGAYTGIREINFEYNNETAIGGFQVTYDLNGKPFVAEEHKSLLTGFQKVKISLNFPSEYIVEVSAYIGEVQGRTVVRSLAFKTNKETYGPYGVTNGTLFNLPIENGLIVGFKGSIGYWLDYFFVHLSL